MRTIFWGIALTTAAAIGVAATSCAMMRGVGTAAPVALPAGKTVAILIDGETEFQILEDDGVQTRIRAVLATLRPQTNAERLLAPPPHTANPSVAAERVAEGWLIEMRVFVRPASGRAADFEYWQHEDGTVYWITPTGTQSYQQTASYTRVLESLRARPENE